MVFSGVVTLSCRGNFKVEIETKKGKQVINATPSGKMRQSGTEILVGDTVNVEIGEFDSSRGRIVFRHKK